MTTSEIQHGRTGDVHKDSLRPQTRYTFKEIIITATNAWTEINGATFWGNSAIASPLTSARTRTIREYGDQWTQRKGISTRDVRYDRRHVDMILDTLLKTGKGKAKNRYDALGINPELVERIRQKLYGEDTGSVRSGTGIRINEGDVVHNKDFPHRRKPDITWGNLNQEIEALARKITEVPDIIAPIVRGGLVPGRILSSCLGVNEMIPLMVEKRDEERVVTSGITTDMNGKIVLLVEDALETGRSLIAARDYLVEKGATVITACLYTIPKSEIKPDYSLGEIAKIPIFPWE